MGMSAAYKRLLESYTNLLDSSSADITLLRSQLQVCVCAHVHMSVRACMCMCVCMCADKPHKHVVVVSVLRLPVPSRLQGREPRVLREGAVSSRKTFRRSWIGLQAGSLWVSPFIHSWHRRC